MLRPFLTYTLFFCVSFSVVTGQEKNSSGSVIERYFTDALNGKNSTITIDVLKNIPVQELINLSGKYLRHADPFIRYKAIDLIKRKGMLTQDTDERKTIVALLIEACKDRDSGNSGVASKALSLFNLNDFSPQAADSLVSLISIRRFFFDRIIRLAGFFGSEKSVESLTVLLTSDSTLTNKEKWATDLALARMGDPQRLESCMEKITGVPVNDKSVEYLFPDLVYMRHPAAVGYMLQEILLDEKNCRSSNPDKEEAIICAFKIMELVAPVIEDFPVKMTSYGELDIEDYDSALQTVRAWILKHETYNINRNIY